MTAALSSLVDRIRESCGGNLLGEIITFKPTSTTHSAIVAGLSAAGIDPSVARPVEPETAFSRALSGLKKTKVVRKLESDEDGGLRPQLSHVVDEGGTYAYPFHTVVKVQENVVWAGDPDVADQVQSSYTAALEARNANDVTQIVRALFERDSGLFPLREAGGVYFIPAASIELAEKVSTFLSSIGGGLRRFPVPAGTEHGDASVRDAVADGVAELIAKHDEAVESFDAKTRESTLAKQVAKIQETRLKIDAYSVYLKDESARLTASLDAAAEKLRRKIEERAAAEEAATEEADAAPEPVAAE